MKRKKLINSIFLVLLLLIPVLCFGVTTTICPTGQGCNYTTLSAWEAGQQKTTTEPEIGQIQGDWTGVADTTNVAIDGWTTSEANYINIYTTTAARHDGKWNTGKYRLISPEVGSASVISISEEFVRVEELQIYNPYVTIDYVWGISVNVGTGDVRISKNILRGNNDGDWWDGGIYVLGNAGATYIWNNILYDWGGGGLKAIQISIEGPIYIYNNTIQNCTEGISTVSPATVAKNNIVKGSGDTYAYSGSFGAGTDYNATDGIDDIGTGTHNRTGQTFTFADETGDDFHLASNDAGARNYGIDLSGDTYLPFSTDIDGQTRPGESVWDIGADEYVPSVADYCSGKGLFRGITRGIMR